MKQWELNGVTIQADHPVLTIETLGERDHHLKLLTERLPAIAWVTDRVLRITSSVGAGLAELGRQANESVGMTLLDYFGTTDQTFEPIDAHIRAMEGESVSFQVDWGGRAYQAHVEPLRGVDGTICGVIGVALDVTERRRAEQLLVQAEEKYRALIEQIPAVTYVDTADESRGTIFISPQVEAFLGYRPQEWKEDPRLWVKLLHPGDRERVLREVAVAKSSGMSFRAEYRMVASDGRVVWVYDTASLALDFAGRPSAWQGVMIDITERRREADRRTRAA